MLWQRCDDHLCLCWGDQEEIYVSFKDHSKTKLLAVGFGGRWKTSHQCQCHMGKSELTVAVVISCSLTHTTEALMHHRPSQLYLKVQNVDRSGKQPSLVSPSIHCGPALHSAHSQESLCVLWPLMRSTSSVIVHTRGMAWTHASCAGAFIFMHLCTVCMLVCVCVYKCDEHRVPIQTSS